MTLMWVIVGHRMDSSSKSQSRLPVTCVIGTSSPALWLDGDEFGLRWDDPQGILQAVGADVLLDRRRGSGGSGSGSSSRGGSGHIGVHFICSSSEYV